MKPKTQEQVDNMSLAKTWQECLRMWKWIVARWKSHMSVYDLKCEWLDSHGYGKLRIMESCFFCHYSGRRTTDFCTQCPGALVEKRFHCEDCESHEWFNPPAFYRKLLSLNKKRKK